MGWRTCLCLHMLAVGLATVTATELAPTAEARTRASHTTNITWRAQDNPPTSTSLSVFADAPADCSPSPLPSSAEPPFVTVHGMRYAVDYQVDPSAPPNNNRSCCPNHPITIPSGWRVAPNNDKSWLAAKMFSFGADALVFSDGTAYATIESGLPNRRDTWNTIAWSALSTDSKGRVSVDYANVPTQKWGVKYDWCLQVLLTQNSNSSDTETVRPETNRTITQFMTQNGKDYATLDDVDPTVAWGQSAVGVRQMAAYAVPINWTLATDEEVGNLWGSQFGCGCLLGGNGSAFYNANKESCGNHTLSLHTMQNGVTIYWPSSRTGSLRILITRPTVPVNLTTVSMKVLLLSPNSMDTNSEAAAADSSLEYAKMILENNGLQYDNIGVVVDHEQFTGDLPLYTVTPHGYIPHYHTIILTSESLSYQREDGVWQSGLSDQQWARLRRYCGQFDVRLISVFTYPGQRYGVTHVPQSSTKRGYLWYGNVNSWEMKEGMVWYYPATLNSTMTNVVPWLYFTNENTRPMSEDMVAGVVRYGEDATSGSEMHLFFASSGAVGHGQPLGKKVLAWAMENVEMPGRTGMAPGTIAGIVIGSVCAAALLAGVAFYYRYHLCYCNTKERDREVHDLAEWEYQQSGY